MRYLFSTVFLTCLSLLLLGGCERSSREAESDPPARDSATTRNPQAADLLLTNARMLAEDGGQKSAQVLAVRDGKILFVGSGSDVAKFHSSHTQIQDLDDNWLLPGFPDSREQLRGFGEMVSLYGEKNLQGYQRLLNEFIAANPDQPLVVGQGWSVDVFSGKLPHKDQLDQVSDRIPIVLFSRDGKTVWANSEALAAAEINAGSENPPGGTIEKDPNGLPTGLLRNNAIQPLEKIIPPPAEKISFIAGSAANFVVLDSSPPQKKSPRAQILQVYSNGQLVFESAAP